MLLARNLGWQFHNVINKAFVVIINCWHACSLQELKGRKKKSITLVFTDLQ
jgi:hypothetical protein